MQKKSMIVSGICKSLPKTRFYPYKGGSILLSLVRKRINYFSFWPLYGLKNIYRAVSPIFIALLIVRWKGWESKSSR